MALKEGALALRTDAVGRHAIYSTARVLEIGDALIPEPSIGKNGLPDPCSVALRGAVDGFMYGRLPKEVGDVF